MNYIDSRIINTTRRLSLAKGFIQASNLYRLFFAWSNAVALVTLVGLGLGISSVVCINLKVPHRVLRYAGFTVLAAIYGMSTVKYGIVVYLNRSGVKVLHSEFNRDAAALADIPFAAYPPEETTHRQLQETCFTLSMACEVVSFLSALAIVASALFIMGKAKYCKDVSGRLLCAAVGIITNRYEQATNLHVVASSLYLIRCIWRFIYAMMFLRAQTWVTPLYVEILDALLDRWVLVWVMSIVYLIGRKKRGGLFTEGKTSPPG